MRQLEPTLSGGGFDLKQIARDGQAALYEQSKAGTVVGYEIIVIQQLPAQTIMGRSYPEREAYPGNEKWGEAGWTVVDKHQARERYYALVQHLKAKGPK